MQLETKNPTKRKLQKTKSKPIPPNTGISEEKS